MKGMRTAGRPDAGAIGGQAPRGPAMNVHSPTDPWRQQLVQRAPGDSWRSIEPPGWSGAAPRPLAPAPTASIPAMPAKPAAPPQIGGQLHALDQGRRQFALANAMRVGGAI